MRSASFQLFHLALDLELTLSPALLIVSILPLTRVFVLKGIPFFRESRKVAPKRFNGFDDGFQAIERVIELEGESWPAAYLGRG